MSPASPVGRRFAGFRVERELGAGGMGLVLLARQESLDRLAVLKRIHPQLVVDDELEARFEREAIAAGRLHHPNVVGVYDRFRHRGDSYLACEFVDGTDLAAILEKAGRLPWRIAATIALELARGLEAIHETGTLHRDLKPQNVLIGRRGEVKIGDFGLAIDPDCIVLTRPGVAVGTPPYMSPEQLRAEPLDPRADLFSFGCLLYEMLAGVPPFRVPEEGDPDSMLARVESGRYPSLAAAGVRGVPRALRGLVRLALRPRAVRRIESARVVRESLEALLGAPSPLSCRHWIADWAWSRGLFETREAETVVLTAPVPVRGRPRRLVAVAALACLAVAVVGAMRLWLEPAEVRAWVDEARASTLESAACLPLGTCGFD